MKSKKLRIRVMKKYLIILTTLFTFSACTDLDLLPADADVDAVVFSNPEGYRQYLAKIYAAFTLTGQQGPNGLPDISIVNDEGFTSYIRCYWKAQELPTDEAIIAWTDAGIRDMNTQTWSSENQFIRVVYYRIFYIIAYANDFLTQSTEARLDLYGIAEADRPAIRTFRAEARFLRALAYWHALDIFRNVPILTAITTALLEQSTPAQLFSFIEEELNDIEDEMIAPLSNQYGRADRAALWMLQAKLYLNAQVYINQTRWDEATLALGKVIQAGYSLAPNYRHLFMADNRQFGVGGGAPTEFIFAFPADGNRIRNWGTTTFLVSGAIGGSMIATDFGVAGGWAGLRTTSVMVEKFENVVNPGDLDPRGIFHTDGQSREILDVGQFTQGYAVPKWSNMRSDGTPGQDNTWVDTDYPMFRLADAYLMYAEAVLRGGSPTAGDPLQYVNALRERAYGNSSGNITGAQLTLDFILDERVRELYWEATRRTDLVRYGQFTTSGIWPWKGGEPNGVTTSAHLNIFPIPASDLMANPRLRQNPEY
jgi:starch-binding outer membrane protein, SusD/RagB family